MCYGCGPPVLFRKQPLAEGSSANKKTLLIAFVEKFRSFKPAEIP
jgi:hypothetical protein